MEKFTEYHSLLTNLVARDKALHSGYQKILDLYNKIDNLVVDSTHDQAKIKADQYRELIGLINQQIEMIHKQQLELLRELWGKTNEKADN